MKKSSQVLICVIAIIICIGAINNLLFSLEWKCRCADEYWAETQCEQLCNDHNGCAGFLLDEESCYYWLYCVDNTHMKVAHTTPGGCPDC